MDAGVTVMVVPVKLPGFHTYVTPPVPVSEVLAPAQIVAFVVVEPMVGNRLTVIVLVAVFVQPLEPVPVTV